MPESRKPAGEGAPAASVRLHPRRWRDYRYVYPVLSRRSRGISIGINLNPDKACNWDCVYCQVDRTVPSPIRDVDEGVLHDELRAILRAARDGSLYADPEFAAVAAPYRVVRDLCFAGDGEPPSHPNFRGIVEDVLRIRREEGFDDLKVVVLTNATLLDRPRVKEALRLLDADHGELWLKLDAGTEAYYRTVDRSTIPFARVLANLRETACGRPVILQSLFMKLHGQGPPPAEIEAYCDRVREILDAGGVIRAIQVYTVARRPAEAYVEPLADDEVDALAAVIGGRVGVPVETYYSERLA